MLPKPLFYPYDHIKATRKKGGKQIESGRMREQERGKSKPCELLNVHHMPLTAQCLKTQSLRCTANRRTTKTTAAILQGHRRTRPVYVIMMSLHSCWWLLERSLWSHSKDEAPFQSRLHNVLRVKGWTSTEL